MIPSYIDIKNYQKVHHWLKVNFGKANKCEGSNCKKISHKYEWSLKKKKKYECVRKNFWQLCKSCHSIYDTTEYSRRFHSEKWLGSKWTKVQKAKYIKAKCKPLAQLDMKGNIIRKFNSGKEAARILRLHACKISLCLTKHINNYAGYNWEFLSILQEMEN